MMSSTQICNEDEDEDEDVVVQDSTLHKHLSKLGYLNFETVSVKHPQIAHQRLPKLADILLVTKCVLKKFNSICSWIVQENAVTQTSLANILQSQILLDDHIRMVHDFIEVYPLRSWNYKLPSSITFLSFTCALYSLLYPKNIWGFLCMSSVAYSITSLTWLQYCADNNLKCVISLQNDLHCLCKRGLNILRNDYNFKSGLVQSSQHFHDLITDRLCYLQPLMECLISYMENVSQLSYKTSLIISELLDKNYSTESLLTKFQHKSFTLHGEINYQSVKRLYNTHVLVQSEMLQLIAIAYNINTWSESYSRIPEVKLNYISQSLIKHFKLYKDELKQIIDTYYSTDIQLVKFEYKGPYGSKWQDLYMQLSITAHKIQLAYSNVLSIIRDIDIASDNVSTDNDKINIMMNKMNEVYKDLDAARSFTEFTSLLMAKASVVNCKRENFKEAVELSDAKSLQVPVVSDSEPEIVDEVFEEYIKEEYIKPLLKEEEELAASNYRLDKLLAKNFMSELKEALIDKHKSMSERESKALQRMYKHVVKDLEIGSNLTTEPLIPTPPPMPSWNICLPTDSFSIQKTGQSLLNESCQRSVNTDCGMQANMLNESVSGDTKKTNTLVSLNCEPLSSPFAFNFPPTFMKVAEEVFIGSGENSEDESTDIRNESNENIE